LPDNTAYRLPLDPKCIVSAKRDLPILMPVFICKHIRNAAAYGIMTGLMGVVASIFEAYRFLADFLFLM
jgi:hypothetical protein